jgi:hypothetical protein
MNGEIKQFLLTALAVATLVFGGGAIYHRLANPQYVEAALTHYHAFEALDTADTETADHDIVGLPPIPTATLQLIVTGAPDTCTYQLEGRLRDGTGWDVLAEVTGASCVDGKMVHFESKAVDVVRGRLAAISGGTAPEVTGLLKMVTR